MALNAMELNMLNAGNNDLQWFQQNYKRIKEEHADEFVAVSNREIVSTGKTLDSLLIKLEKQGIDSGNVLIEFVSKIAVIF